jgi:hypothetical protein
VARESSCLLHAQRAATNVRPSERGARCGGEERGARHDMAWEGGEGHEV